MSSPVQAFVGTLATQAFATIGAESVVIGATTLSCVLAEVEDGRDFATGGFEVVKRLTAVCKTADLPTTLILKKLASTRGETFRVESVRKGGTFTTIMLEQVEKS